MKKEVKKLLITDVLIILCVCAYTLGAIFEELAGYIIGLAAFIVINVEMYSKAGKYDGQLQIDSDDEKKDIFRLVLFEDPDDIRKKDALSIQVLNGVHLE